MNSIEQLERLIQRLPAIARDTKTVEGFWQRVDDAMELVWDCVKDESERREITLRFEDLEIMASGLGIEKRDTA